MIHQYSLLKLIFIIICTNLLQLILNQLVQIHIDIEYVHIY